MQRKLKKQPLNLTYNNIVVGSSLEAVIFAYQTNTPLICTRFEKPYYFETIEDFGLGTNKLEIWNRHIFLMSIANLVPLSDKIKLIRYVDANKIKIVTTGDKTVYLTFNRLFLFDDHNFYDLPTESGITTEEVMLIDWMSVQSGKYHDYQIYERDNKFINKIIFFPSGNPLNNKQKKDCIVISYIKEKQLHEHKYADYMMRIKTENIMKELGIQRNGAAKITLEHKRRDVVKLGKNTYNDFDNVIYMNIEAKSAYEFTHERQRINYLRYAQTKLGLNGNEQSIDTLSGNNPSSGTTA